MAVWWTFRDPSLYRHVRRELMRNVLRDLAPTIPATACHQRHYVETYSRSNQTTLWPSEIVLTDDYYYSLKDHAIPYDFRALKAIQNKPRAQDIYLWMTQRLCRIEEKNRSSCAGRTSMRCSAGNPRETFKRLFLKI